MLKNNLLLTLFVALSISAFSQSLIFAELTGSPTLNTTGWNLTGAAAIGDTGGDPDANPDELILTNNVGTSSGGAFYSQPIEYLSALKSLTEQTVDRCLCS